MHSSKKKSAQVLIKPNESLKSIKPIIPSCLLAHEYLVFVCVCVMYMHVHVTKILFKTPSYFYVQVNSEYWGNCLSQFANSW